MSRAALVGLLALSACRTELAVVPQAAEQEKTYYVDQECTVRDYPGAADVPVGAITLGVVRVSRAASDEETYLKLREAICAKGGDALSQLRWVLELGKFTGAPTDLEADAWRLP